MPRLLDLFCGAGGAAMGYHRAGFDVVGVDIAPQPRYPFTFHQGDALEYVAAHGHEFDMIHASPPCQAYSWLNTPNKESLPKLIAPMRSLLRDLDVLYIIENVYGARHEMQFPFMLCGASFHLGSGNLDLPRHRLFESNRLILAPPCQHRPGKTLGVYGHGSNTWHRETIGRDLTMDEKKEAMGIDWMRRDELTQAIPPAYTEWIGKQLINALRVCQS